MPHGLNKIKCILLRPYALVTSEASLQCVQPAAHTCCPKGPGRQHFPGDIHVSVLMLSQCRLQTDQQGACGKSQGMAVSGHMG
jgi:hypothetical protein